MEEQFKIYVDRLREGQVENIQENIAPASLNLEEEQEVDFQGDIGVEGEAYIANDTLILHFRIEAHCIVPCTICTEPVPTEIIVSDLYHAEPLQEIKGGIFCFKDLVREVILLEVPDRTECEGNCPQRKEIERFLKKEDEKEKEEEGYHPFADL